MEKYYLRKYINKKVYMLSKLKLSRALRNITQLSVDNIVNSFDTNEETFKDLDQVKKYLAKTESENLIGANQKVIKKDNHKTGENKKLIFYCIFFVLFAGSLLIYFRYLP
jgi:hypothetical protein